MLNITIFNNGVFNFGGGPGLLPPHKYAPGLRGEYNIVR
jgi:hypothetical protein